MTHETGMDWDAISLPGVEQAVRNAANAVARQYQGVVEGDDLFQEGLIHCASEGERTREYVASESLGLLFWRVKQRLINEANKLAGYSNRVGQIADLENV